MLPILYSNYNCPHSLKVAFFLSEKGVGFQRVEVDLSAREQKSDAYLAKNPARTVPAYEDDNGVIGDSLAIMRYIDARIVSTQFFPADPDTLADVLAWIEQGDTHFWDVSHHLYWQLIEPPADSTNWSEVERLKEKGFYLLGELESRLAKHDYICGEFSAADIAVLPWIYSYKRFDLLDEVRFPHVIAWYRHLSESKSFVDNYRVTGIPFQEALAIQSAE